MRVSRLQASLLLLLLTFLSATITARADDDEPDDYDVKARVVRISLISGEANLKRNESKDWERVQLNYPVVEGDTLATTKDSRIEMQFDARNFVRLAENTVLRVVTLRDEGTALSVIEGTVIVRLAKFDRGREYFEIDAPRSTLAAEKPGLYRVDVPPEGRVRLTVREGGSARIYSDTSGFALRDGRSAELVVTGPNAGDWDLLAAAAPDAIDGWITERESYLAQRFRPEPKYFDEHVWGAEDLDSYGEWVDTKEYGWLWRPHASVISVYSDWAPYRYGHWTWCPPYGWTWVGYEPWGWAPYHYGRWVFYNNGWAWVPRSHFHKKRSWWRPALVAFISFDFSFGNNICWYPLSYHQRDPYSRYYRRHDRNPGYGGGGAGGGGRYGGGGRDGRGNDGGGRDGGGGDRRYDRDAEYKNWRGVTRVPRRDFGNGSLGRPVDEPVARRVMESVPQVENLPQRPSTLAGTVPSADGTAPEIRGRRLPELVDRPTGAATREPGVALDEDLRRQRVYRGREPREPRQPQPTQPPHTAAGENNTGRTSPGENTTGRSPGVENDSDRTPRGENNSGRRRPPSESAEPNPGQRSTPVVQTPAEVPPSGALERPEPSSRPAPGRIVRPSMPDGVEKRIRGQQAIESSPTPRTQPEPRQEQPRSEPPAEQPRPEPRQEQPRSEPRVERPTQRYERPEPSESRPQPRSESPRSDPQPRNDPPPRSDPPRSDPPARSESPRSESPRSESPRSESPRSESPRSESPRSESPRSESPRSESPRPDPGPRRPDNF